MNEAIDPSVLYEIKDLILSQTGILFDDKHTRDLERHIINICNETDIPVGSWHNLLQDPVSANNLLEALIRHITIGETYFFRDKNLFLHLKDLILPDLIRERRKKKRLFLRIWSAACSSGEEPYSLAIILRYLIPDIADWDVFLIATDINQKMLDRAEKGEYSRWSFRDEPIVPVGQYFSPTPDNLLKIDATIKKMVRFERMNLIRDTHFYQSIGPSSLDLILCRNVLMYFSKEQSSFVISRLVDTLHNDGTLIVSPQEIGIVNHPEIHMIHHGAVFLHIKKGSVPSEIHTHHPDVKEIVPINIYDDVEVSDIHFADEPNPSGFVEYEKTDLIPSVKTPTQITDKELFEELVSENQLEEAGYVLRKLSLSSGFSPFIQQMETLIKAYAGLGDYEKALGWSERMIAEDTLNPRPYLLQAAVLDEIGHTDASLHSLRQSLYADPDYLPAHLTIAGIYMRRGKKELARHHYNQSVKLLDSLPEDQVLKETEGIPADKLKELIFTLLRGK